MTDLPSLPRRFPVTHVGLGWLLLPAALFGAGCFSGAESEDQSGPMTGNPNHEATAPPSTPAPVVLSDGRVPSPERILPPPPSALPSAWEVARTHWRAMEPGWEEEFRLLDMAGGAFTRPGVQQEAFLYLASRWPRCCPKMGLMVLEEGEVVRHLAFVGVAQQLRTVPDLDGDGRDELWMEGSFGMGGFNSSVGTLLELPPRGGVREWGTVPTGQDGCAAGGEGREALTYRIVAYPGPAFTSQPFRSSCEAGGWEAVGEPEPLVPDPDGGMEYVELEVPQSSRIQASAHAPIPVWVATTGVAGASRISTSWP